MNGRSGLEVEDDGGRKKTRALTMGDLRPLELQVQEESLTLLKQSKVGFFRDSMDFQTFQSRLLLGGHQEVNATYMGGNMVLLQGSCERVLAEALKGFQVEEGYRSSDRSNSNSDERAWKGDDGDIFSDGRTDSDRSESYQVLLVQQGESSQKEIVAIEEKEDVRSADLGSAVGEMMEKESVTDPMGVGHVVEVGECDNQVLGSVGVRGNGEVGQDVDLPNILIISDERMCDVACSPVPLEAGPLLVNEGSMVGPNGLDPSVGPCVPHWNPFVDPVEEVDHGPTHQIGVMDTLVVGPGIGGNVLELCEVEKTRRKKIFNKLERCYVKDV
ncbi:hypothetical protein TSUD_120360 [Trifolium subterraneum]|uniref:Uncharacterized protein n=1 Tax=Trifolium subterraneum TaxID=3900 RepID=A0A2Z6LPW6_TRISU|nr:hypothetical protein TSUD_120360 [Trifolium subterraneum]